MQAMTEEHSNARAVRVREAIESGPLAMSEIADTLGIARTSVLNWKRKGSINLDNLKGLAELTGYRFWWLAFGEGPKTYADAEEAPQHSQLTDVAKVSPEHARLIECISHLTSARVLTPSIAEAMTHLLNAVADSKKQ
ncbi:helix-turn-helix domain-containing protein [Marinobacter xestospongiae]|uniref:helix-turn-helix domain-containing protein n=1 Tax=Marinobacter xestospongiae TaxID=994319 RepID=UPI002006224A|nr:helix-turn-helix domain-containing protein [Marinobacter xestospongiae]MCK7568791.1 helix-turn-helix domain containing protein [Marinobacter xestospongiae]